MIRLILYAAIGMLIYFVYRLFKSLSSFRTGSKPNLDDLKDRAEYLKNKYKNVEEADYRDITSSDDEQESSKK